MKTCPNCRTQYTDDTLRFCLQDGATLDSAPVKSPPMASSEGLETETAVRRRDEINAPDSGATPQSESNPIPPSRPASGGGMKTAVAIAGGVLGAFLIIGLAGLFVWFVFLRADDVAKNTDNQTNRNGTLPSNLNSGSRQTPLPTPTTAYTPTPAPSATPVVDRRLESEEVRLQINNWKSHSESGDLDAQMQTYAPTVNYYRKSGASRDFIRADRQRAYRMFDSMSIDISNENVTVSASGETATAEFDKEWIFEGESRSTGKVRQHLQFRKVNGQWLITGERDIKVYYTN